MTVLAPSGTKVVNGRLVSAGASGTIALSNPSESGTYKVQINPSSLATGSVNLTLKTAAADTRTKAFTTDLPHPSLRRACLVERLTTGFLLPRPDWLQVRADRCDALKRQAAAKEAKAKKAAGVVPEGADGRGHRSRLLDLRRSDRGHAGPRCISHRGSADAPGWSRLPADDGERGRDGRLAS